LLISLVFALFDLKLFSFLSFLTALYFAYSFRNPERELGFLDEKAVVSPVDGVVIAIDELQEEVYAYKIIVESDFLNVAILRVPLNAKVQNISIKRGARTSKYSKLFRDLNEKVELEFMDIQGNSIKVVHTLKQSIAPIKIAINKDVSVFKGNRYGTALNTLTEIYLPKNFRLNVNVHNEIEASHSLIGYLS
jgi:phosphatidylserine decarboxylase